MSTELAGAGAEQAGGKNLSRINTDRKNQNFTTEDAEDTEKQESKDRKGKNLPLINTDDADQKSQELKGKS